MKSPVFTDRNSSPLVEIIHLLPSESESEYLIIVYDIKIVNLFTYFSMPTYQF